MRRPATGFRIFPSRNVPNMSVNINHLSSKELADLIVEANKRWDPCNEIAGAAARPGMTEGLVALLADLRQG